MNCILKNSELTVLIDTLGAEPRSVKRGDCEYIWQGGAPYWKGRAPWLFPICGRLQDGAYTYEGKRYEMALHGFARRREFAIVSMTDTEAVFVLESNEETRAIYPFDFSLTVHYRLEGARLSTDVKIVNRGACVMPATFGAHPGFNLPLDGEGNFSDYVLEFGERCSPDQIEITENGLLSGKRWGYPLRDGKVLPLSHDLFAIDGIFLARMADSLTLKREGGKRAIRYSFPSFPYLGIWHDAQTEAPFVCLEPWCGLPDYDGCMSDMSTKHDMFRIEPGATQTAEFSMIFG